MNNQNNRNRPPMQGGQRRVQGQNRPQNQGRPRYVELSPEEQAQYEAYRRQKRAEAERRRRAAEEEARRREAYEKARRKKQRKQKAKIFGGRLLVFFAVLVLVCAIIGLIFLISFRRTPDEPNDTGKIRYFYGGREVRKAEAEECVTGDGVYICFNDLSDYLGMAESGTAQEMKFIIPAEAEEDSEYIVFYSDAYTVNINGQEIRLDIPNSLRGTDIWVTSEFVGEYMHNVSVSYNEKANSIYISKIKDEENSTSKETVYLPVSFTLKSIDPLPPVVDLEETEGPIDTPVIVIPSEEDRIMEIVNNVNFISDLSAYEQYMNPQGELRDAFLILVNTKHHLTANDIPPDLSAPGYRNPEGKPLREYAARALEALFMEMDNSGFWGSNMAIRSAYRDYANQAYLFEYYTNRELSRNPALTLEEAQAIVLTFSTRPGTSEHQTGLAVDMDTTGTLVTDFQYTDEYKWLSENAWKFGFILRFPEDKTDITTIQFEPWHYRYVGRYHAYKIYTSGLCLEEYIEQLGE